MIILYYYYIHGLYRYKHVQRICRSGVARTREFVLLGIWSKKFVSPYYVFQRIYYGYAGMKYDIYYIGICLYVRCFIGAYFIILA